MDHVLWQKVLCRLATKSTKRGVCRTSFITSRTSASRVHSTVFGNLSSWISTIYCKLYIFIRRFLLFIMSITFLIYEYTKKISFPPVLSSWIQHAQKTFITIYYYDLITKFSFTFVIIIMLLKWLSANNSRQDCFGFLFLLNSFHIILII